MSGTVLVTGSSRGIGRAIALRLASDGFDVALHCLARRDAAEATAREIENLGRASRVLQFDVGDRAACLAALAADMAAHGAYYGVVCNAGTHADGAFPSLTGEDWDGVIRSNLDAFYNVLQPVVMPMIRRRKPGRIVTLSSVSGLIGNRGQVNYSAAKAGIIGLTMSAAKELAKYGITVNAIAPGAATPMTETIRTDERFKDKYLERIPMGRWAEPDEIAPVFVFFASDAASYVTGQMLAADGGMTIR